MPHRSWFRPRADGLGWEPATREGWIVLATVLAIGALVGRIA